MLQKIQFKIQCSFRWKLYWKIEKTIEKFLKDFTENFAENTVLQKIGKFWLPLTVIALFHQIDCMIGRLLLSSRTTRPKTSRCTELVSSHQTQKPELRNQFWVEWHQGMSFVEGREQRLRNWPTGRNPYVTFGWLFSALRPPKKNPLMSFNSEKWFWSSFVSSLTRRIQFCTSQNLRSFEMTARLKSTKSLPIKQSIDQ